jgi:hypothetical protein
MQAINKMDGKEIKLVRQTYLCHVDVIPQPTQRAMYGCRPPTVWKHRDPSTQWTAQLPEQGWLLDAKAGVRAADAQSL